MLKGLVVILLLILLMPGCRRSPNITQAIKVAQAPRIDGSLDDAARQTGARSC